MHSAWTNDDFFDEIFRRLPMSDQIRCREVGKRFQQRLPICPRRQSHLDVKSLPFGSSSRQRHAAYSGRVTISANAVWSALKSVLPTYSAKLKSISFVDCQLVPEQLDVLAEELPHLSGLDLGDTPIHLDLCRFAQQLSTFTLLRSFTFGFAVGREDFGVASMLDELAVTIAGWNQLEKLNLTGLPGFPLRTDRPVSLNLTDGLWNDNHFHQLAHNCPNVTSLTRVQKGDCRRDVVGDLMCLQPLPHLESLTFRIGSNAVLSQLGGIRTLKNLNVIINLESISDEGLRRFSLTPNNLVELRISSPATSYSPTDIGIAALVATSSCPRLERLFLEWLNVGDSSLLAMASKRPLLSYIGLIHCSGVTQAGFEELLRQRRSTRVWPRTVLLTYVKLPETLAAQLETVGIIITPKQAASASNL